MSKKGKKEIKKNKKVPIIIISLLIVLISGFLIGLYIYGLSSVSKKSGEVTFKVNAGESKLDVVKNLKDAGIIKSEISTILYIYLSGNSNLQAGTYTLDKSMDTKEIISVIHDGLILDTRKTFSMTFVEGQRLKDYVKLISKNTSYTEEEIYNVVKNDEFLNKLIEKYWFIDDSILNTNLYYGIEGYLFPSTYEFYDTSSIEDIIYKLLDQMDKVLTPFKEQIDAKNLSVHELLSMASIIEKEALNKEDREKVSQVIYTRLSRKMSLGMDVTTYYAVGKDMTEALTKVDLSSSSPYNTRNASVIGLPVGPICNPSKQSIEAALNPTDTNYVYFYADVTTGKVYFAETATEFYNLIKEYGGN